MSQKIFKHSVSLALEIQEHLKNIKPELFTE